MEFLKESELNNFKKIVEQCTRQYKDEENKILLTQYILDKDDKQTLIIDRENKTFIEVVRRDGSFVNFPGIEFCDELSRNLEYSVIERRVKYGAYILKTDDNRYLFLWTVQPYSFDPGDEWGYGMEEQAEICLYSYLDVNGKFTESFKLYSVGGLEYFEPII